MSRRRWVCKKCGRGALGSERPRRNATVRYCLPCSEQTGALVERVCPALERKRTERKERHSRVAAKRRERRKRKQHAKWVFGGYDLRREVDKISRRAGIRCPHVEIRHRKEGDYVTGRSFGGRVVLTIPRSVTPAQALALTLHELAHEVAREGHGECWRATFVELTEFCYDVQVVGGAGSSHDLHDAVEGALEEICG